MPNIPEPPFRVVSVDPGLDTGLSLMAVYPESFGLEETQVVHYDPLNGISPLVVLRRWGRSKGLPVVLLYENFHVRPGRMKPETTALRVIGGIEEWIRSSPEPPYTNVIPREPVQGKLAITNEVLDRMGMLGHGGLTRHVNDAVRHTVAWLVGIGYVPACKAAWPSRDE